MRRIVRAAVRLAGGSYYVDADVMTPDSRLSRPRADAKRRSIKAMFDALRTRHCGAAALRR